MIVPLDVPHARAVLRVEVAQAAPGKPFLAAVEIATDPHWHVYWRNPGDSGAPTKIEWQAPKGWKVEPLESPIPKRFAPGGVAAYGYEGKTLFLARVTPTKTSGTITAKADWLVCNEACVIGKAALKANVSVGDEAISTVNANALRSAERDLPSRPKGWQFVARQGKGVVLTGAAPASPLILWKQAEFFPAESGVVDQGKRYLATFKHGALVFQMDASPFPEKRTQLAGLIVYSVGAKRFAFKVSPSLETGEKR